MKVMKTYYCVATTIYDGGRVVCNLISAEESVMRPKNVFTHCNSADHYMDYFDTEEEANEFVKQSKKA